MNKRYFVLAGKNNIAVDVLSFVLDRWKDDIEVFGICNKTETGENGWQKSYRKFLQDKGVKECELEEVYNLDNMVFVSLEYDRLIKPQLFKSNELYNIHFSLLPEYKGMYTSALPIINGETYSGVTFHRIDSGIDTGDIICQKKFDLDVDETCESLYLKYINNGTELVKGIIESVIFHPEGITSNPQNAEKSSYYSRASIDYSNLKLNMQQTAINITRQVRAYRFRPHQLVKYNGKKIIDAKITNVRSLSKPGSVVCEDNKSCTICSIDYDVCLIYDRFEEVIEGCKTGNISVVKDCFSSVSYINERTPEGWDPLIIATYNNQTEIVKFLISKGSDIHTRNYHDTNLLMYAKEAYRRYKDRTLFDLYKSLGVDLNQKDEYQLSVVDYCKKEGLMELIEV